MPEAVGRMALVTKGPSADGMEEIKEKKTKIKSESKQDAQKEIRIETVIVRRGKISKGDELRDFYDG